MAKSLRSKWKRKMRAVKRVRYGEKEAKMLNKIIEGAKARREEMEKEHKPEPLGEGKKPILTARTIRISLSHTAGPV